MAKKRIAVLFGGASADHSASLRTAYSVLSGIPKDEYEPLAIGITRAGRWLFYPGAYENILSGSWETDSDCCSCILSPDALHKGLIKIMSDGQTSIHRVDAVFPVLHGKYGEDGRIQGLCKLSGLPLIGNDLFSSSACQDKKLTYMLLEEAGLSVTDYLAYDRTAMNELDDLLDSAEGKIGYPAYVSPSSCSSSIGSYRAMNREQLENAVKTAFSHHSVIVIEKEVSGRTIECAVLGGNFSNHRISIGELIKNESRIDASSQYIAGSYSFQMPAKLDGITKSNIKQAALTAFTALGCKSFARIDLILNDSGIIVRRVRGIPGLDENNMFTRLVTAKGEMNYSEMLDYLISSAIDAR